MSVSSLSNSSTKKVSFCNDAKDYDGCCEFLVNFSKVCNMVLNPESKIGKIDSLFDLIDFLDENKEINKHLFIEQCLDELSIIKSKLLDLQKKESIYNMVYEFYKLNEQDDEDEEKDEYWNNEFWQIKSQKVKKSAKKIALLRKGSRDMNLCVTVYHLKSIEKFIQILNDAIEWC